MPSTAWEIIAAPRAMTTAEQLADVAGRPADDLRNPEGLTWVCKDVGAANAIHNKLKAAHGLVSQVIRRQRRVTVAARGLMSLALLVLTLPALAQDVQWPDTKAKPPECPADRPHKMTMASPPTLTTGGLMCPTRLICRDEGGGPTEAKCWYAPDCPSLYEPRTIEICLSADELARARK